MNDTIFDCIFPVLHLSDSASTYKQLSLVNKRFNKEFKHKETLVLIQLWLWRSANSYFWNFSSASFDTYFREKNSNQFKFKLVFGRFKNCAKHVATLTIDDNIGLLSIDSGNSKYSECDYDSDESDSEDDDEFYKKTIRTFTKIHTIRELKETIGKVITLPEYY